MIVVGSSSEQGEIGVCMSSGPVVFEFPSIAFKRGKFRREPWVRVSRCN